MAKGAESEKLAPPPGGSSDSTTDAIPVPPPGRPPSPVAADKVRIRFRKDGSLRLLSHHDLLRTFERLLRRADIPCHRTQGFNPHPRIVFALSLPLGVVGLREVVEIELSEVLDPGEVRGRMERQ